MTDRYGRVPPGPGRALWRHGLALGVYRELAADAGPGGMVQASTRWLADVLDAERKNVQTALGILVDGGHVEVVLLGKGTRPTLYRLLDPLFSGVPDDATTGHSGVVEDTTSSGVVDDATTPLVASYRPASGVVGDANYENEKERTTRAREGDTARPVPSDGERTIAALAARERAEDANPALRREREAREAVEREQQRERWRQEQARVDATRGGRRL